MKLEKRDDSNDPFKVSSADFCFPKTWEKHAGESISYVYNIDPSYLSGLMMRTERPIRGLLRDHITAYLDIMEQ